MLWGSPRSHMESPNGGQFRLQDHRPSWVSANGTHLLGMWWAILAVDPSARLVHLSWQYLESIGAASQSCVQVQCCEQINDSRGIHASALLSKQSYKADIISITPTLWMRGRDERDRQIIQDYTASKWRRHENTDCVLGLVHIPIGVRYIN